MVRLRREWGFPEPCLDIGVGDGRKRGTVGVDLRRTDQVEVIGDGTALPFTAGSFASVVCYHVIEHLEREQIADLLAETRRVLRPGGRAYLLVDRDVSRQALLSKDSTHVERYDPASIREAVGAYLDIGGFETHNLLGNVHNHPLQWWRLLDRGTKVYVEAVKP